jgi:hypothetical protein
MKKTSPFKNVYLFHGKGGAPSGTVLQLERILRLHHPEAHYERPFLPHGDPEASAEASLDWAVLQYRPEMVPNSLIVGISLGGLIAAKLQEMSPSLNLSVVAIISPTSFEKVRLETKLPKRMALYSKEDKIIDGRMNWEDFSDMYFDLPMYRNHNVDLCKYATAYLISRFMLEKDVQQEIEDLFPVDMGGI